MKPIETINWENKKKEIVFLGRLTRMKRTDHAIRAFQLLHKEHPEYQLNIIGNPQDEEYGEELQILTTALGISESVHFV
jgi:glycosyltransferase involved in cell wall biosynthesis